MPAYPGVAGSFVSAKSNVSPITLQKGESHYVVGALAAGATQLPVTDLNVANENFAGPSVAVNLLPGAQGDPVPAVSVEVQFSGAPGAGESIAVQEADTDADGFFITPAAIAYTISAFTANNAARVDFFTTGGKFLRVNRTRGANALGCTIKMTRLA